jgi:hypothetical protein
MAINKNHEFEELDGVKCAIVEKNVSPVRVEFLKKLLEYNKFKVVVIPSPPPKVAPALTTSEEEGGQSIESTSIPVETFTVGVTDYTFNSVNAIFGRLLHTPDGHVVTLAYWQQKELVSHDEIPYFEIDRG